MSAAGAPSSWNSSSATIRPRPRAWQRAWPSRLAKRRSSSRNSLPISALRLGRLRESSSRRDASAIAQPTGWPRNVLVWIASPADCGQARSITDALPTQADNGKPPVSALPRQRMSGVTLKCSLANQRPVRPKPVYTSSQISSAPCLLQTLRSSLRKPGGGMFVPPRPWMGSTKIAPTLCLRNTAAKRGSSLAKSAWARGNGRKLANPPIWRRNGERKSLRHVALSAP